jgi:tetratricopeptide (TPR) repeat protein
MMHHWIVTHLFACVLAVVMFGGASNAFAQDTDRSWVTKIISVQGRVVAQRKNETGWQTVKVNDTLFAGDRIRVEANSRAGIVLSNDAVLRLDQNTTLVFTEIKKEMTFIFRLLKGAANFFSRRPRSLNILTPFANGVVEGTEFYVQVDLEKTRIDLFEGRILAENQYGQLQLAKGQGAVATAHSAPQRRVLVQPRDSVQWALYYPPVPALGPDDVSSELQASLAAFNQGRPLEALNALQQVEEDARDTRFYIHRAALRLHVGRVSMAENDIRQALTLEPENGQALALRAIISVVQNRKAEGMDAARQAVQRSPASAAAHIALSYAHQAGFDLANAVDAARAAVAQSPENGTAWARLAELRLSTGQLDSSIRAARKAAELNPHVAHAHTVLGFAYLTQIKTDKARAAFDQAISLDSAAPLPRLGLGLAKIRDGELKQGRGEIEIAAGLDPANALIRSYLGKAYFDEKRGPLDGKQLDIAKTLDPNDPTPWYYDAIRKQSLNRPVEALQDLQRSIELNDNRAVYRSRLLLDDDLAARSAGLGRIYSDLGFEQLALSEGWKSINTHHGDHSGHRLLADSYSKLRGHDIARASELLQSQLLQPLNLTPLQPQLGETELLIPEGAGPAKVSFNEFNPLFTNDGVKLQTSGVGGSNNTFGDEMTLSGLYKRFSYSLGQLHYKTDGFRDNNDLTYDIYNVFAQVAPSARSSVQVEYRSRKDERGDLRMFFDPESFAPNKRTQEEQDSVRIGGNLRLNAHDNLVVSLIHSELDLRITDNTETVDPFFEFTTDTDINTDIDANSGELQYLRQSNRYTLITGLGYVDQDRDEKSLLVATTTIPPFPPTVNPVQSAENSDTRNTNAYIYTHLEVMKALTWTLGVSYDAFQSRVLEEDKLSPKTGILWSPHRALTFRAAWFQNIKRPLLTGQTIEPTQIAGFNQFFDDFHGSETERYGVAVDVKMADGLFGGIEFSWRNVDLALFDVTTRVTTIEEQGEEFHRVYFNWMLYDCLAFSVEGFWEEYDNSGLTTPTPFELTTYRYPIGISYQSPIGLYAKVLGTYVDQEMKNTGGGLSQSDNFWVVDATIGYRFPGRLGTIVFGVKNAFDEAFSFQDYNFNTDKALTPFYVPDAQVFGQITLAF